MQTHWLSYFLVLAQSKSFSDTAMQLGINSSTLGRKMRQLEQELGLELFSRFSRPLTLTSAGQQFLKQAPELLQTLYQIEHLHLHVQQKSLSLAWHGAWGVHLLPQLMPAIQKQFPAYRIESHSLAPVDAFAVFESGLLDFWLTTYQVNGRRELELSLLKEFKHIELFVGATSDFVIVGKPGPMDAWNKYHYIDLSLMTFDTPLWDESCYPRTIKVCLTSVSDAVALCCQSELLVYLPRVLIQNLLDQRILSIRAEAPETHTIQPGILLNHASLKLEALPLVHVLQDAGFEVETII